MVRLAMDHKMPKILLGGVVIGKPLFVFSKGAFGHIFRCKDPQLLVNRLADETDGDSELVEEYHIAQFRGKSPGICGSAVYFDVLG
jgi:hypothetical protein